MQWVDASLCGGAPLLAVTRGSAVELVDFSGEFGSTPCYVADIAALGGEGVTAIAFGAADGQLLAAVATATGAVR
jgi:hypothetical protein